LIVRSDDGIVVSDALAERLGLEGTFGLVETLEVPNSGLRWPIRTPSCGR
jgi:hypothetical protein